MMLMGAAMLGSVAVYNGGMGVDSAEKRLTNTVFNVSSAFCDDQSDQIIQSKPYHDIDTAFAGITPRLVG